MRTYVEPSDMIDCHKCKHYYVTWDRDFPHGCHAMEFKSYDFTSKVVYKSSGIPCLMFKSKDRRKNIKPSKDASNSKQ
jgi:hypothetical protein